MIFKLCLLDWIENHHCLHRQREHVSYNPVSLFFMIASSRKLYPLFHKNYVSNHMCCPHMCRPHICCPSAVFFKCPIRVMVASISLHKQREKRRLFYKHKHISCLGQVVSNVPMHLVTGSILDLSWLHSALSRRSFCW